MVSSSNLVRLACGAFYEAAEFGHFLTIYEFIDFDARPSFPD
jgi:hypothetical protein